MTIWLRLTGCTASASDGLRNWIQHRERSRRRGESRCCLLQTIHKWPMGLSGADHLVKDEVKRLSLEKWPPIYFIQSVTSSSICPPMNYSGDCCIIIMRAQLTWAPASMAKHELCFNCPRLCCMDGNVELRSFICISEGGYSWVRRLWSWVIVEVDMLQGSQDR